MPPHTGGNKSVRASVTLLSLTFQQNAEGQGASSVWTWIVKGRAREVPYQAARSAARLNTRVLY